MDGDGRLEIVAALFDGLGDQRWHLYVWDADAGKPLFHQKIAPGTLAYGVAWSPDGKQLAVAASDNKGYILDVP